MSASDTYCLKDSAAQRLCQPGQPKLSFFFDKPTRIRLYEAISKMSFGPISLLVPRFKSSKYGSIPPV
jgi:hypothetical protein